MWENQLTGSAVMPTVTVTGLAHFFDSDLSVFDVTVDIIWQSIHVL